LLFKKIIESYNKIGINQDDLVFINIWSNLTLLDLVLKSKNNSDSELDNIQSERELLNIYLTINETFGKQSDEIFKTINKKLYPDIVDYLSRATLTLIFPYHDLNHFKAVELLVVNFIKSYYCFQFLELSHKELLALFLKPYSCENWQDYLKAILPIGNHAINENSSSGLNYLNLANSPNKEKSKIFLDHLSLVDEKEYSLNIDFLHARANPLFKSDEENYLILDSVLAVNRIYNSMFFELLRIAEKNTEINKRYKDFFSIYTYDFIEKHLSYTILDKIFSKTNNFRISGDEIIKKYRIDTEPDYYVRNGNKVFLFEVKASIIKGTIKQSFSYEKIEKELKEKYFFNEVDNENKAIIQLIERIEILFKGEAIYDPKYKSKNVRIFPILIVTELVLTTPGINYVFNQWFQEEIVKNEILKINKHRIYDLVIIDIDTLILYSDDMSKKGVFEDLLNKYYSEIDKKKIHPKNGIKPTGEYLESLIMKSIQPFNGFVRDKLSPQTPDIFLKFGSDLLKDK
jgi:hypothetical protein